MATKSSTTKPVMTSDPGLVAILAYNGLCTFEFGIAAEIFALPRPEFSFAWYRHCVVALDAGPMLAMGGLRVHADAPLSRLRKARTIVVPGWRDRFELPPENLLHELRLAHARGARILSICSGVFVLAASGLLNGKRATTHWRYADDLARMYPSIKVDADVLYVDEDQLVTSAGSAAGIDACLHLVQRDFGTGVANTVARRLVMSPQRQGGQVQFIPAPVAHSPREDLAELMQWIRSHLIEPITVAQMASKARMSERSFLRKFSAATGVTPKIWLQNERLARARELLENSQAAPDKVAELSGFSSSETFRSAFRASVGLSPTAYRARFGEQRAIAPTAL